MESAETTTREEEMFCLKREKVAQRGLLVRRIERRVVEAAFAWWECAFLYRGLPPKVALDRYCRRLNRVLSADR